MGLRLTQGDEKRRLSGNHIQWKRPRPLCHPERTGSPAASLLGWGSRGICGCA
jgi:hypothetical protein